MTIRRRCLDATCWLAGAALAAVAVSGWRVPPGEELSAARIQLAVHAVAPLFIDPSGPSTFEAVLLAGGTSQGTTVVVDGAAGHAGTMVLDVRRVASDLDPLVHGRVAIDGEVVAAGPIGQWAAGATVAVGAAQQRTIDVELWLPPTSVGHEARSARLDLTVTSEDG